MKKYVASYKDLGFDESFVKEAKEKIKNPLKTQKKEKIKKLLTFKTQSKKNKKTLNKGYLVKKLK